MATFCFESCYYFHLCYLNKMSLCDLSPEESLVVTSMMSVSNSISAHNELKNRT